jgi:hypothetical protein
LKQRQKPLPREIIVYIGILGKEKKNKTISSGFENKNPMILVVKNHQNNESRSLDSSKKIGNNYILSNVKLQQ